MGWSDLDQLDPDTRPPASEARPRFLLVLLAALACASPSMAEMGVYLVSGLGTEKPNPVAVSLEFGAVDLLTERSGIGCGVDGLVGIGSSEAGLVASWIADGRRGTFHAFGVEWLVGRKHSEVWAFESGDVYQGILLRMVYVDSWGCAFTAGTKYRGYPGGR